MRTAPTSSLRTAYAEPQRRYHSQAHIDACLDLLDAWPGLGDADRRVLGWAIWWHDAVYDPTASDNEARSAALARRELPALGASPGEVDEVARLIRLTAGHEVENGDRLGAVLVSIDLAVLSEAPSAYDAYARAVREEYAHVPEPLWRAGRARVLQRFLDAPVIFPDPDFRAAREPRARANLARELETLR
ncbi:HD domain-containing protein [Phenylobacterium sp.]|uniref:HD domain-containing protein n=1 Tax=Phenylobacterium sp. TaxID=1871053 RepID=UPI002FE24293